MDKSVGIIAHHEPEHYSLIHGDPHSNNFLLHDGALYPFDKNDESFSGSVYIDLAIVCIDFPNGTFIQTNQPEYADDLQKLEAFVEGYGTNFLEGSIFQHYLLLVAFRRMNSPHAVHNKAIVKSLLERIP